jgi:hypothetical protein
VCRLKDKIPKEDWAINKAKTQENTKNTEQSLLNAKSNTTKKIVMKTVHHHTKTGVQHMFNTTMPKK